jgi:hypothetical protein
MALADSFDYTESVSRADLIKAAYQTIGMVATGDDPTANETARAAVTLNFMIKAGQGPPNPWARDLKLWKRERYSVTLDVTKNSYSIKPSGGQVDAAIPVRILSALYRNASSEDTPLRQLTFEQYEAIPVKGASGTPQRFYYERRRTQGVLYLDCKPISATPTVELVVQEPINDMDATANNFDFPAEWFEPLHYNLAVRLAAENGIPVSSELAALSQQMPDFDQENTVLYFQPGKD